VSSGSATDGKEGRKEKRKRTCSVIRKPIESATPACTARTMNVAIRRTTTMAGRMRRVLRDEGAAKRQIAKGRMAEKAMAKMMDLEERKEDQR
jgi:hypothetical protein